MLLVPTRINLQAPMYKYTCKHLILLPGSALVILQHRNLRGNINTKMEYAYSRNPFKRRYWRFGRARSRSKQFPDPKSYLPGHVLTEAIPDEAPEEQHTALNLEDFDRTGDSPRGSALLRIPIKVRRRIYDLLWEDAGLTRHIYVKDGRYTHTTCITDHDAEDERQVELWKVYPRYPKKNYPWTIPSGRAVSYRRG